ncbi:hypothetical protein [Bradyrhizobium elkanii]
MTAGMYTSLADIFKEADEDEAVRVVLWHGAGDAFCAGNTSGISSRIRLELASPHSPP